MKFPRTLARLAIFALAAAVPASAQHSGSPAIHTGGVHPVAHSAPNTAAHLPSARRPFTITRSQPPHAFSTHSPPAPTPAQTPSSRLALQNAPPQVWHLASSRSHASPAPQPFRERTFGFHREPQRRRPFPHFPQFFFGGGPAACSPLLPGFFGAPWFDRQFTCFGTPFYGVDFYPQGFLAPEQAYEPWLRALPEATQQQMYAAANGASLAGNLDITAAIAARESAESDPSQQVTTLVLKEGINFGVIDYWLEDGKLAYITTYGRENTIDLDRLDRDRTEQLNSSRGIPFVLRVKPSSPR